MSLSNLVGQLDLQDQQKQLSPEAVKQSSTSPRLQNMTINSQQPLLKCRLHTYKFVKYICLDQNCDHQRLMCQDCENSDHFNRHRNKCILLQELMEKAEQEMEMKNWPQDTYLRSFQEYLKGQTNHYENTVIEMCKRLLKFMQDKMEEIASTMINLCGEEQKRNQEKNRKLLYSYIEECNNLDSIRELIYQLNSESNENNYKYYQQQVEKKISTIINETLVQHTQYKQQLNQKYGFGYFEGKNASKSLLDFSLIQQEFDSIRSSLTQMGIFIEKNATISKQQNSPRQSQQFSNSSDNIDLNGSSENGAPNASPYDLSLTTIDSESDKIIFRTDEKSATIKRITRPTFFFTNVIPQQTYFQVRITGIIKCGTYFGLIDDSMKQVKVNPTNQQNHFVGICLACPQECYGNCKTKGPGFNFNVKDEFNDDELYEDRDDEPQVQTIILNIFINLTKKLISLSDISNQKYLKFDLDDKNYFYNRDMRLYVQTSDQIKFEILQYSKS